MITYYVKVITDVPLEDEPVTLDDAKFQGRLSNSDEDIYLQSLIAVSRHAIENYIGRQIGEQTLELGLMTWPQNGRVEFPKPPLISVLSIKYTKEDGTVVTWYDSEASPAVDPDSITIEAGCDPGVLFLNSDGEWPSDVLAPGFPIKIRYKAGITTLPADLKHAMLLMGAHHNEHREGEEDMPPSIARLCDPYKTGGYR